MLKINYMSTLFVGIDVSSKTNAVYAMDFEENKYISSSFGNNQPGADQLANMIAECMQKHKSLDTLLIVLESTSVYSVHISHLSTSEVLMPYKPYVKCRRIGLTTQSAPGLRSHFSVMRKNNLLFVTPSIRRPTIKNRLLIGCRTMRSLKSPI